MKKIKILYVMDHYHFSWGGTEGQVLTLIENLDRERFEPQVCVFRHVTDYLAKEPFPCRVFCPEIEHLHSLSTYWKLLNLRGYIRENAIDIVQTVFNDSALVIPFLTLGTGARTVSTRRDMGFWYTPLRLNILRMNKFFTDRYVVNSNEVKRNLIRKEWVPPRKITVIPNACDMARFDEPPQHDFRSSYAIPADAPVIGVVANLRPVKRVIDMIEAFPMVLGRIPESYLVIVGHTGDLLDVYQLRVRELGIGNRVRFLGLISNPIPIIKHFSVGVNCSESEGLSNAIIEYMGCGVPVVATDTEGNRELVLHGRTGLLAPVGNTRSIAESITTLLLMDNNQRNKMVNEARRIIHEKFDEKKVIRQYESFYIDIDRDGRA